MYELFSDRARRVVFLTREEAGILRHDQMDGEHILLGLIREAGGVAAGVLEAAGISLAAARRQVEELTGRGQQTPPGRIPFAPRARKVLEHALRESVGLGHGYIGTGHLLLGLLRDNDSVAAQAIVRLGADPDGLRGQLHAMLAARSGESETGTTPPDPGAAAATGTNRASRSPGAGRGSPLARQPVAEGKSAPGETGNSQEHPARPAAGDENLVARALVRVLGRSGDFFGFGLLIADGKVVTCAHVVALAMDAPDMMDAPSQRVLLDFPFLAPGRMLTASVAAWTPMAADGSGDFAGLRLDDAIPPGASPLAMTRPGNIRGHEIMAYGYQAPREAEAPTWVSGVIVDRTEKDWLQLGMSQATGGPWIRQGFSGTPVWDVQNGQVVGLVTRGSLSRKTSFAYAVSGEVIFNAWPELRESFRRVCPFRSLVPFEAGDADQFCGRTELAAEAVQRITGSEQTLVTGASGAGKTSLINAAVIPGLERDGHAVIAIRPLDRESLWNSLAAALAMRAHPASSADRLAAEKSLAADFAAGSQMSRVRRLCDGVGRDRVVIVVDRFEELLLAGTQWAREFAWDLGQLPSARHPEGRPYARVVIVVREDYEPRLRNLPPFDAAPGAVVHVGPLTPDQLRDAVVEPVRRAGFARYEDHLVERIIDDVRMQPYALPALQVILTELWERQTPDGLLRHSVYQELNRGPGPLATHLDRRWRQLSGTDTQAALRLLLHLVIPVGESGFARRSASQDEVSEEDWRVAGTLATLRLLVLRAGPDGGGAAELVHDALIEQWPALAAHLAAHRDLLTWRDDLRRRITAWQTSGSQPGQLLSGAALRQALSGLPDYAPQLSPREEDFLRASRTRHRRLRRRWLTSAVSIVTAMAALVTFALIQQRIAQQNKAVALSRQLAATSVQLLSTNPQLAALLSVAAYKTSPTSEARASLAQQFENLRYIDRYINPRGGPITGVAFSPDGRILAIRKLTRISLWNISTNTRVASINVKEGSQVTFSPDGSSLAIPDNGRILLLNIATRQSAYLAAATGPVYFGREGRTLISFSTDESKVIVWNLASRRPIMTFRTADYVTASAISPDGELLATNDSNFFAIDIWNLRSGKKIATLRGQTATDEIYSLAFGPSDGILAAGDKVGRIELWNVTTRRRLALMLDPGAVDRVAFSPDGRTLISASAASQPTIWDVASHKQITSLPGVTGSVNDLAFSPDGHLIAGGGDSGTAVIWRATPTAPFLGFARPLTRSGGSALAFSPDGRELAIGTSASTTLWDTARLSRTGVLPRGADELAFSPDGRVIATASFRYAGVYLWDASRHTLIGHLPGGDWQVVAFSPDGRTIATAGRDTARVTFWDVASLSRTGYIGKAGDEADSLAFTPDGKKLAVGGHFAVTLWDPVRLVKIGTVPSYNVSSNRVYSLAISHGGTAMAWGASTAFDTAPGPGGEAVIWDLKSNSLLAALPTHSYEPVIALSPGADLLASGDNHIYLWSVQQHAQVADLGTANSIQALAFSPSGEKLVAAGKAGVTIWSLGAQSWIHNICSVVGRNLTHDEWNSYLPGWQYRRLCSQPAS